MTHPTPPDPDAPGLDDPRTIHPGPDLPAIDAPTVPTAPARRPDDEAPEGNDDAEAPDAGLTDPRREIPGPA